MDELMMYEYLKKKGIGNMNEQEFMNKFKTFMNKYKRNSMRREDDFLMNDPYIRRCGRSGDFMDMPDRDRGYNGSDYRDNDMDRFIRYMRNSMNEGHFSESEAKYLVAGMYHIEGGRKYSGEKFDIYKAKEVCERYRGILPTSVTAADVYIAINAQYHDYAELFKNWFGDNIDQKVIESAIIYWFKDADAKSENKLFEYFKEY